MTTALLTRDQVDAELADRHDILDAMSATLLELDGHPGITALRSYPQTGRTAQAWEEVRGALTALWDNLGRYRTVVQQADQVRARRSRPTEADLAELTALLRGESVQPAAAPVPLERRSLTGNQTGRVSLQTLALLMDGMFAQARDLAATVDTVSRTVRERLAPLQQQWTAETDRTRADQITDPEADAALQQLGDQMVALTSRSVSDPLSVTDAENEIDRIGAQLGALVTRSQRLAELQEHWPARLATLRGLAATVAQVQLQARQARQVVAGSIRTAPLPDSQDRLPALNAELDELRALTGPWPARARRMAEAEAAAQTAVTQARADLALATGLLDRRVELRGRLTAYRSKAERRGVASVPAVAQAYRAAADTLAAEPCDLARATKDVAAYQLLVNDTTQEDRTR